MCRKSVSLISSILTIHLAFSSISMGADPNLVGWWKFDEGSGTAAIDSSGNGLDGTINGNPTWGAGSPYDKSGFLLFDGAGDFVDINYTAQGALLLPEYTVALWFRVDGGTGHRDIFSAYTFTEGANPRHGILLELRDTGVLRYIHRHPFAEGGIGGENVYTTTTYNDGRWHHVALVRSAGERVVYVDSKEVGSSTEVTSAFDAPMRVVVGVLDHSRNMRYWNGALEDIRIYNRPLSLAEVQGIIFSLWASLPSPANGATDVPSEPTLSWTPGRFADTHNVYFGTDFDNVSNASTADPLDVLVEQDHEPNNYAPGTLALNQTYYWRIDEVNDAHPSKLWTGAIWGFTTANYLVVDDMESYGAAETPGPPPPPGSSIWYTWKDGAGWTVPSEVAGNGTGSVVDSSIDTVHGGNQSVTLFYSSSGTNILGDGGKKLYSEIRADTSYLGIGRDWAKAGVNALTLWFYGDTANDANATEQMYIKLNGVKVNYDGDMNDIRQASWHEWSIDLAAFGIDLTNVTEMAIGFGNETNTTTPGGSGTVYFDDIRLYQPRCILSKRTADFAKADYAPAGYVSGDCVIDYRELEIMTRDWLVEDDLIATANPGPVGLAGAYYPFDEGTGTTTADASGNGRDGTSEAGVTWVTPGLMGDSAIHMDGTAGSRVSIGDWDPASAGRLTVSIWVRWSGLRHGYSQGLISKRDGWSVGEMRFMFEIDTPGNNSGLAFRQHSSGQTDVLSEAGVMTPFIGRWVHTAATFDGATARLYLNGEEIASGPFTLANGTGAGFVIGNTNSSAWPECPECFNGDLDEARIYSRALSAAEIAYLADLTPDDGQLHVPVPSPAELYDAEQLGSRKINLNDFAILADRWLEELLWP